MTGFLGGEYITQLTWYLNEGKLLLPLLELGDCSKSLVSLRDSLPLPFLVRLLSSFLFIKVRLGCI